MKQSTLTRLWVEYCELRAQLIAEGQIPPDPRLFPPDGYPTRGQDDASSNSGSAASRRQQRDGAAPERDKPGGNDERF